MSVLRMTPCRQLLQAKSLRASCSSVRVIRLRELPTRSTLIPQRHLSSSRKLLQGPNVQQVTGTDAQVDGGGTSKVEPPDYLSEGELHVFNKIKQELEPIRLEVQDISGGCGSMYGLDIVSSKFAGLSVIKQHQLVNRVLKEDISKWHGVQLKTKAP